MRISKKDWIFIAIIAAVFATFYAISGEEKTKRFKKTGSKMETDKGCPACHFEPGGVPFPPKHPAKPKEGPMRCLFCHKLKLAGV
jgi:hypothetical protein